MKFISLFKNGVSPYVLSKLTGYEIDNVERILSKLFMEGLISYSITDIGFIYKSSFMLLTNHILKGLNIEYVNSLRLEIVKLLSENKTHFLYLTRRFYIK
ncbi:hypothetical protein PL321_10145 [Caloramator sp. mosi_1]|uniref:hypothetical protein n=1 Tax=Caloramator sp. mosi_1 TaxID=3023090 RepID=UPI00235DF0BD|nr:hypothetical protein [Caloramator sp. mosi_1]WDC83180.1 hypothetical protein PL321_10145 [Caloramator sp. mosi_1]